MALYSAGFKAPTVISSQSTALCDFRASATDQPRIFEISGFVNNLNSNLNALGIGRPATIGTAKSSEVQLIPYDLNSPASSIVIGYDWTVPPTSPTNFLRRLTTGASASAGLEFRFRFPGGITVGTSGSLALWLTTTTATAASVVSFEINVELDG